MPTDLFGARFYGHRVPAWHHLGRVSKDKIGAVEALRRVGPYDVVLEPSGERGRSAVIRLPTHDAARRSFGTVDADYVLVPPAELTALWDASVGGPVETLGALLEGRCLFLTMRLETYGVRGDGVSTYLALAHWMAPNRTSVALLTPVRVVCSNTLRLAERMSQARIDLAPTRGVRDRIAECLRQVVDRSRTQSMMLRQVFQGMADRTVSRAEAWTVVATAYPDDDVLRRAALDLFDGAGTGMDHPAASGTAWGLYNAIAELENFREGGTDAEVALDVLFGDRCAVMQRAFEATRGLCGHPTHYGGGAAALVRGWREEQPVLQR
jgi:hypothetical protein